MTTNAGKVARDITKLSYKLSKSIDEAVSKVLVVQIRNLKHQLKFIVNEQVTDSSHKGSNKVRSKAQKVASTASIGKSVLTKEGSAWHNDPQSEVLESFRTAQGNNILRVKYDIPAGSSNTYNSLRKDFEDMLVNKPIGIPDANGDMRYYAIPKNSLMDEVLDDVKIFCSDFRHRAGQGESEVGEFEGKQKFKKDKEKGFTEFTLKARSLEAIKSRGEDITDLVRLVQGGNFQEAYDRASTKISPAARNVTQRISGLVDKGDGESDESDSEINKQAKKLGRTNKAIDNITVSKKITEKQLRYDIKIAIEEALQWVTDEQRAVLTNEVKRQITLFALQAQGPIKTAVQSVLNFDVNKFNSNKSR